MKTSKIRIKQRLFDIVLLTALFVILFPIQTESTPPSHHIQNYAQTPLTFEQNNGQTDDNVKFLSRGQGYALFLTQNEAILSLSHSDTSATDIVSLQLINANPNPSLEGIETQQTYSNYLIGNNPTKWQTNVAHVGKVKYHQVYDGIDLIYYGNQRRLEYDFLISPGIAPKTIKMRFSGAKGAHLDDQGNLILQTNHGDVVQQAPISYQTIDGQRHPVVSQYVIHETSQNIIVGFQVGQYDASHPLVIDPILSYSTYLGGNDREEGSGIAVDDSGNVYVTGYTKSSNFPVTNGSYDISSNGNNDIFLSKFDATGTLVYSTYLGGNHNEVSRNIALDSAGNVYITGLTSSTDFPVLNAYQNALKTSSDAFIAKFNDVGTLVYSTYFGGNSGDDGYGIALDTEDNVYITGITSSSDLPVLNAYQQNNAGSNDIFIAKFDAAGALTYATYLGGSSTDEAYGIDVDISGNAYVVGQTFSSNFPTQNPFQATRNGERDAVIAKLNSQGNALIFSTHLGGGGVDIGRDIAIDPSHNICILGLTTSGDFPIQNAIQPSFSGGGDFFITKMDSSGSSLVYSTYLEGNANSSDNARRLSVDLQGNIYVTGELSGDGLPLQNPVQLLDNSGKAMVAMLNAAGTSIVTQTFFPAEDSHDIATDQFGNIYLTGMTRSNITIHNAYQNTHGGGTFDAFLMKISPLTLSATSLLFSKTTVGSTSQQTLTITNDATSTLNVTDITITGTDSTSFSVSPTSFSLSTGQSQNITISYSPTATGSHSASLSIANNISGNPLAVSLNGQGKAPNLTLSASSFTFGNAFVDSVTTQTLTISNTGDDTLTISSITPSGNDASLFSVSPSTVSVSPNNSQNVTITFAPTSSGSKTATLSIAHNASGSPSTISLTGQGVTPPTLSLSATTIDFGNISAGSSATRTLTLSNSGDDALSVSGITLTGTDASLFSVSPSTSFSVPPSQSQTLTVTFSTTSAGSKTATLSITHNATGSPSTVSITGQGIAPALSLSATTLTLGPVSVGNTTTQTLTVSNTGDDTLKVSNIELSGTDASLFSVSPTSFTVAPSQNQTVTVTFAPTSDGSKTATLSIAHNATGSPSTISITGQGTAPDISLSANSLSFGDVDTGTEKTLTLVVSNLGSEALTVSQVTSSNDVFTISPSSFTVSANNNQGLGITFKPTSTGNQSATITLASNDPDEASLTITLSGNGTDTSPPPPPPPPPPVPVATFSSSHITFGNVLTNTQSSLTLTISNTGQATLTISDVSLTGDAYSISSSLSDIEPGQNGSLSISFTPTATGETTGTIAITHNASGSPNTISLSGTGVVEPAISIAQTSLDFGQALANTTGARNLTIKNTGNADLQITGFAFSNPRFETGTSTLTIAGGDSQQVAIHFLPVTGGLNTGTLTIAHNASSDPIQIDLSGEGTLPLGLQISPSLVDFERVDINGQSNQTLQLENPGTDTLTIITLQTHRLDFHIVQGDSIPVTLAPSESKVLDLLFFPRRSGQITGDLTLATTDSTFTIPLTGEGVVAQPALNPQLNITPEEITFSKLSNTVSDTATITLSNTHGTGMLLVTDIQSTDALVTVNADSFIIKPGEQRMLQVVAHAAERDFPTGQITFTSNDPTQPTMPLTWRAGALLEDFVLLDLDSQSGDQSVHRLSGVLSGDTITVELYAKNFPTITGYGMFVDYNTHHLSFLDKAFNTNFIPGATEQIRDANGQVNFGVTSFAGIEASGDAFLGELSFKLSESFADSTALTFNTITLSLASGNLQELPQKTTVWLIEGTSPDFTGDGQVDFRDFLLFGQAFGSSNPAFDLNGDGTVGFPDFIIFAAAFGG